MAKRVWSDPLLRLVVLVVSALVALTLGNDPFSVCSAVPL